MCIINHYENNHAQSRYLTNYHTEFSTKLSDYVSSISSAFFTYDFNDPKLLKDPGFRSMTARWFQMITFKVSEYKRLLEQSEDLLNYMKEELDGKK